jgi:hypothetical protein
MIVSSFVVVLVAAEEAEAFVVAAVEVVVDHNHNLEGVDNIVVEEVQRHLMDHKVDFVDNHIVGMDVAVDHYSNHQEHHHNHN